MNKIRNFCIIAHIDHGKSTLADRMLEITGTIEKRQMKEQVLDQMDLERERGITIKLQPVRMKYQDYILNLIDTPGHVDFSYEVSRSLAAVEGALLLVDATQGIQAQTLSTLYQAMDQHLKIIPVINKIDLPVARPEQIALEVTKLLKCSDEDIIFASGKTGQGVEDILKAIIDTVPAPKESLNNNLQALVFDSKYDLYRGVVAYIRIFTGELEKGAKIKMLGTGGQDLALEIGYFEPNFVPSPKLQTGEIGYIITGFKDVAQVRVGDTVTLDNTSDAQPLPGYKTIEPNVFASIFTTDRDKYPQLRDSIEKLKLNDAALTYEPEKSQALGFGFRCGFLGLLHLEIVKERLEREFNLDLVTTAPSVSYKILLTDKSEQTIYSAYEMPDITKIEKIFEPISELEIITPSQYLGNILNLINKSRGTVLNNEYLDEERVHLTISIPLAEVIIDFFDQLKGVSAGFASMSYQIAEFKEEKLEKVDILVNGEIIEPLSVIVPKDNLPNRGREIVEKLKTLLPKQNYAIPIQAACGGAIIARETVSAFRKDVIAKLYGGDVTRKTKLLDKQKKGKKRLAKFGKVEIPSEVFLDLLKR